MKMENLDLFKDLMEQAMIKKSCDAEDARKSADHEEIVGRIYDRNKSIPGEIRVSKTSDGVQVLIACSSIDASILVGATIEGIFRSFRDQAPDKLFAKVLTLTAADHLKKTIDECVKKNTEGEYADE